MKFIIQMLVAVIFSLFLGSANLVFATVYTYNFDCNSGSGDTRDTQTITMQTGDTATINTVNCTWAYTSGAVTPTQSGTAAQSTYTVASTGSGTINIYKPGVYGYDYTFNHTAPPLSASTAVSSKTLTRGVSATPFTPVMASGGTTPYSYAVSPSLPTGLSFDTATGQVSGTPTVNSSTATYTVTVTDNASSTATSTFSLTVNPLTLTITPSTLPVATKGAKYSQQLSASGGSGPFTYSVASGSLPPGLSLSTNGLISGYSTDLTSHSFTITVTNSYGDSGSQSYTMQSASSPDPTHDVSVVTQIEAQTSGVHRLVQGQIDNIASHLQHLHSDFSDQSSRNNLSMNIASKTAFVTSRLNDGNTERLNRNITPHNSSKVKPESNMQNWNIPGLWIGGDVNYGSMRIGGGKNKFSTTGVSLGMDKKLREDLIFGLATGFGWDNTKLDDKGSKTAAVTPFAALYASFKASSKIFIDGLVGYGNTLLKNTRWQSTDNVLVKGNRRASSFYTSMIATYTTKASIFRFDPYIRGDLSSSKLKAYSEKGATALALSYNALSINHSSISGGFNAAFDFQNNKGIFTPYAKLQYSRNVRSSSTQAMYYTELPGLTYYHSGLKTVPKESSTGQIGLRYRNIAGTSWELLFSGTKGSSSYISKSFGANMRISF